MLAQSATASFDLLGTLGPMAIPVGVIVALWLFVITPQRKEDRDERERARQEYRTDMERLHMEHREERAQWIVALDDFKRVLSKISEEVAQTRRELNRAPIHDDDGN
jgi:hypothetical protein